MLTSSVTTKGQVTIPAELREKLGIKPGDKVSFIAEDDHILVRRQDTAVESLFGVVKAKTGASLEQMDAAVVAGRNRRARG